MTSLFSININHNLLPIINLNFTVNHNYINALITVTVNHHLKHHIDLVGFQNPIIEIELH